MEITYFGLSAFRLRGKDVTVVTDPVPPGAGLSIGKTTADIVTVSSPSAADAGAEGVGGEPRVVAGPGEYEIADVLIAGVATGTEQGVGPLNTAYVLRIDDMTICHLGRTTALLTDQQVEDIGSIDVLLVPVGGSGALGPTDAAEVVAQLNPSIVIPMRYRIDGLAEDGLEPVDLFCREMGLKEFVPEPKLSITRSVLTGDARVVVLERRGT